MLQKSLWQNEQQYAIPRNEVPDHEYREDYGTFKDSLKAPIHRWFTYPAGYSYKLVEKKIREFRLGPDSWVIDPFVGCGTTSVVAKMMGVNSIGIEAHPFVHWVAKVKTFWEYDTKALHEAVDEIILYLTHLPSCMWAQIDIAFVPALLQKCYSQQNLQKLLCTRDFIARATWPQELKDYMNLALASTLRIVSKAGTGWPYIAPTKYHEKTSERDAFSTFCQQVRLMEADIDFALGQRKGTPICRILHEDARSFVQEIPSNSMDLLITSPPYLNNYDYADRTRLEMYFFGWANSWKDITRKVRDRLLIAATTQIRRGAFSSEPISSELRELDLDLYNTLSVKVRELSERRLSKGGKKSYDLMVAGYFNDMIKVIKQMHRVMKPGSTSIWVLGDSAPYGVHIPTEEFLGRIACAVGFKSYSIETLRKRGDKWAHNPQRHKVALKESILYIYA